MTNSKPPKSHPLCKRCKWERSAERSARRRLLKDIFTMKKIRNDRGPIKVRNLFVDDGISVSSDDGEIS